MISEVKEKKADPKKSVSGIVRYYEKRGEIVKNMQ